MPNIPDSKAALAQRRLIGQLRRSERPGAAALAAVLDTCTAAQLCRNPACPVCGSAFQRAAVALTDRFIREPARRIRNRTHGLTIVPSAGCVDPGDLTVEVFQRVAAEVTAALDRAGFPPSIIGLEASFNEDTTGQFDDYWSAHTHGVGLDWPAATRVSDLKADFPPSPRVRLPVKVVPLDQRDAGRRYPFKAERVRRVTELVDDNPERAPYRDSVRRDLRPWQAVSLAIVEHQLGFDRRLLIHGIDEGAVWRHLTGLGWPRDGP